jgi:hypothetical protein
MEVEIIAAIVTSTVAAAASITCAWLANRNGRRAEEAARITEAYRKDREALDVAKWKVLKATMEGVTVLLRQAKGERLNGNVEAALDGIEEAEQSLDEVQAKLLARMR